MLLNNLFSIAFSSYMLSSWQIVPTGIWSPLQSNLHLYTTFGSSFHPKNVFECPAVKRRSFDSTASTMEILNIYLPGASNIKNVDTGWTNWYICGPTFTQNQCCANIWSNVGSNFGSNVRSNVGPLKRDFNL